MARTSHFTVRTQLGTVKEDILIAERSKNERLYGGAGDDLLISQGRGGFAHGGSGTDIFAFRFNKNILRRAKRGEIENHVIEDFRLEDGDIICLSDLATKSRHRNIDYRGSGGVKGSGIEVRLVKGRGDLAKNKGDAFIGIEDGIKKTLGEIPEISQSRRFIANSRIEVYEDGNLLSNITLKNTPDSRSFSRKLGRAILGKYSKTYKNVTSAKGMTADHLTDLSITPLGIPIKGNGAKMDFENASSSASLNSVNSSTRLASSTASLNSVNSSTQLATPNPTQNLGLKSHVMAAFDSGPSVDFPNYDYDFRLGILASVSPKITLNTGHVIGIGAASFSPSYLQFTQELDPPFTANASAGGRISVSASVDKYGTGKELTIGAEYFSQVLFEFSHHGIYTNSNEIKTVQANAGGEVNSSTLDSTNAPSDGITGVTWHIGFAPYAQFTVGLGVGEGDERFNLIQSGPRISLPFTLNVDGESNKSTFTFGTADLDWTLIIGSFKALGINFTGPSYNMGLASFGNSSVHDINW